jgi:hypothetical protein
MLIVLTVYTIRLESSLYASARPIPEPPYTTYHLIVGLHRGAPLALLICNALECGVQAEHHRDGHDCKGEGRLRRRGERVPRMLSTAGLYAIAPRGRQDLSGCRVSPDKTGSWQSLRVHAVQTL